MWYETIVKWICSRLLDFCEFLDFVLLCFESGMKSGMKTRQQSNCKNCSSLEPFGKHESVGESAIPERAQYKGLHKDRGLSNSRGLPSGRGLLYGCGRSLSIGNDSIRNENDNREDMNFLERMASSLTKNVANPRGPILTGRFSLQVILYSANLSRKC